MVSLLDADDLPKVSKRVPDEKVREYENLDLQVSSDCPIAQPLQDFDSILTKLDGKVIGQKYRLESVIGSGGLGVVYKGMDILVNRPVAIKVLSASKEHDGTALMRFQREAQAAIELKHPNIVGVRDFGVFDDKAYLVMEFVEGTPLSVELTESGPLEPERATKLLKQLCAGLALAHESGIAHRDIKPQNLLIKKMPDGTEELKIIDFGIAKFVEDEDARNLTQTGDILGTPNYMSPEQCEGKKTDQRSDVYSVGCVAFEMFTGKPPFAGDSILEVLMKHVKEPPPPLEGAKVPSGLSAVIERAMEKVPERRYASAGALLTDIELGLSGQSKTTNRFRFSKRKAKKFALVSLLLLSIGGLITYFAVLPYVSDQCTKAGDKWFKAGDTNSAAWAYHFAQLANRSNSDARVKLDNLCLLSEFPRGVTERKTVSKCPKAFENCFSAADEAIKTGSNDYRFYLYRASSLAQCSDSTENDKSIIQDYKTAINLNPKNDLNNQTVAYVNLAILFNHRGKFADALEAANGALRLHSDSSNALSQRALAQLGLGKVDESIKDATRALESDSKNPVALLSLTRAYLKKHDVATSQSIDGRKYLDAAHSNTDKLIGLGQQIDNYYLSQAYNTRGVINLAQKNFQEHSRDIDNQIAALKSSRNCPPIMSPFEESK